VNRLDRLVALAMEDEGVAKTKARGGYMACHLADEKISIDSGVPSLYTLGVSLGRIVRFAGHQEGVYTVLPHSLVVAALMPPEEGIYGLMHDVQETLTGDVPRPFKTAAAMRVEDALYARIARAYGVPDPCRADVAERVHKNDNKALVAEVEIVGYSDAMQEWFDEEELVPDREAVKLTRRYNRHVVDWMFKPELSGAVFERKYREYMALAGLEIPNESPKLAAVAS